MKSIALKRNSVVTLSFKLDESRNQVIFWLYECKIFEEYQQKKSYPKKKTVCLSQSSLVKYLIYFYYIATNQKPKKLNSVIQIRQYKKLQFSTICLKKYSTKCFVK